MIMMVRKEQRLNGYSMTPIHRRNEERAQGVPWAPPIRSKMGSIRSKIGDKRTKMGPFWGVVFH